MLAVEEEAEVPVLGAVALIEGLRDTGGAASDGASCPPQDERTATAEASSARRGTDGMKGDSGKRMCAHGACGAEMRVVCLWRVVFCSAGFCAAALPPGKGAQ